jgi:ATP-binding cassette, subfamily C, bacterial
LNTLPQQSTYAFIRHFLTAHPARSTAMVVLLALGGLAEGIGAATMLPFLNAAMGTGDVGGDDRLTQAVTFVLTSVGLPVTMPVLLGLIVVGIWLKSAFLWLGMTHVGYLVAEVTAESRLNLMRALLKARWSFFVRQKAGTFANAISSESDRAAAAYREACAAGAAFIQIGMYLLVAFLISWPVALAAIVSGLALVRGLRRYVRRTWQAGQEKTVLLDSLTARLTDIILGIKALKAMGTEDRVTPFLEERTKALEEAQRKRVLAMESMQMAQEPIVSVLLAAGLLSAVTFNVASLSEILVLAIIFYRILRHFNTLQVRMQLMSEGESAFWSILAKTQAAESAGERWRGTQPAPVVESSLEFEGVRFAYDVEEVLKGISLRIPAGAFVSVVGESGSGKTTMADLTAGLLEPTGGRILVDGVDLGELDIESWRERLGYVPQDLLLFNGSLRDNVTLGEPGLSDDRVWEALDQAGARPFVESLAESLGTELGERAARLSGGQRQRIALARALVRRPRFLILDEVTAALDPETELQIAEVLRGLAGAMTIFSISHRSVMNEFSDIVVHLADGQVSRIVENQS